MIKETGATPDGAGGQVDNPEADSQKPNSGEPNGDGKPEEGKPQDPPQNPPQDPDGKKGEGEGDGKDDGKQESDQPIEYSDFEVPEGMELDKDLLDKATPIFKELGLTQEQAQRLVSLKADEVKAQIDAHENQVKQWGEDLKNDKELGGDNFEQNMSIAKKALEHFGTPELAQLLDASGLGNHPDLARFFVKVGKLTLEDQPNVNNQNSADGQNIVDRWYGGEEQK